MKRGITMLELLVVVAVLAVLMMMLLPKLIRRRPVHHGIRCVSNLRNVGLAFRIFATDNGDKFPMEVSTNNGGSREFLNTPFSVFRHFAAISNELSTPSILACLNDRRTEATNWVSLRNTNISYFVGLHAAATSSARLLSGDRNLSNGVRPVNGFLDLRTNLPTTWLRRPHTNTGQIAFADGSVRTVTNAQWGGILQRTGDPTNRIALPENSKR